jgi:hypothetical protein
MHETNMLHDWKRRTVDGKSATASCSRRFACSSFLLVILILRVLTHTLQYDRVDPTEFQSLKDEIESLKVEKSAWETERATHTSQSIEQQEKVIISNKGLIRGGVLRGELHRLPLWRR